jgi:REP element-mobilizing transposase RayT
MPGPPRAHLLTFRTYATWLHGDGRGSMQLDRCTAYGTPDLRSSQHWRTHLGELMTCDPMVFSPVARKVVDASIREVCTFRSWSLLALNVRTNHVHVVLAGCDVPNRAMATFKAWSTRRLREAGVAEQEARVWARHGSTRYLWSEDAVQRAVRYVVEGQG